jgi:hypothetical protein
MRNVLLLFLLTTAACLAAVACGDDPGFSGLPYAYPIDATPDGVIMAEDDAGVNRH